MKLLSDKQTNLLRGKCLERFKPSDDVWKLLNHYTLIEHKLDELDGDDFFGTEGWRHFFGIAE